MSRPGSSLGCVVLAYAEGARAPALARELVGAGVDPASIIVVHNPRDRGTPPPLALPVGVVLRPSPDNVGYAAGMNAGIREHLARGAGAVLLLTHEVQLAPDTVQRLLEALAQRPDLGLVGPVGIDADTDQPFSYGMRRRALGAVLHDRAAPPGGDAPLVVDAVDGAAMLVRAAALEAVGLLDERFFMYCEEVDLCRRIQRAGWGIAVVPGAQARSSSDIRARQASYAYLMTRNGLAYAARHEGPRGVAIELGRVLSAAPRELSRPLRTRGRDGINWAIWLGGWAGVAAFATGAWGAPPAAIRDLDAYPGLRTVVRRWVRRGGSAASGP